MFGYAPKELNWTSKKKCVNKTIGHVNKKIQSVITSMNDKELESINVMIVCNKESNNQK